MSEMGHSLLVRLTSLAPSHFSISSTSIGKFVRVLPDNSPATFTIVRFESPF